MTSSSILEMQKSEWPETLFYYDQTQQWQPSQFQPPPQPPPRQRKSKKEFTIGCGIATAVLAQCIVTHIQLKEVDI